MDRSVYIISADKLADSREFADASAEELRVLLSLIASGGSMSDVGRLADAAGVSVARTKAALTLWREAGIITEDGEPDRGKTRITEEHGEILRRGELPEQDAEEVSRIIRERDLAPVINEFAKLMGRAALNQNETKTVAALVSEYSLTVEYLLTLAAHLSQKQKLSITRFRDEAIKLCGRGIDELSRLEKYVEEQEYLEGVEWEYRRLLNIGPRIPSETERELIRRWSVDFGFSIEVVNVAYDVCVMNLRKVNLPYMDKLLTAWHEAGCKTAAECKAKLESDRAERQAEREEKKSGAKKKPRSESSVPKYGNFDVNEAFAAALNRSFCDDD